MTSARRNYGILEVIRSLSAQGASGRLQISTGTTDGALFFNRGELVDAQLANLNGFQAVNALASVPDGSYRFDPTIPPPTRPSISTNERLLLKDFFGIEAGNREPAAAPTAIADDDEVTLISPRPAVVEPLASEPIRSVPPPILTNEPIPTSRPRTAFRPAWLLIPLIVIIGVAIAAALMYRMRQSPGSPEPVAQAPTSAPAPAGVPQQPTTNGTTSAVPDLNGNWTVVNTVEQTSYEAYKNMRVGFNVSINQNGKAFTGRGEKISENGRSLPAAGRTPIEVKGTINGDKVEATFSESGAMRKTNGRFVWRIDKSSGGLTGTFVSTAARTSGKSAAKKEL